MAGPILVTGITGNVGREVAQSLLRAGHSVRGGVRNPAAGAREVGLAGVEWTRFDFGAPSTWEEALRGVTRLFLMRPPAITDVRGVLRPFIERAKAAGVRHVVFLSLQGADKNPFAPHRKIEAAMREVGLPFTSLRAGFFMQNLSTTHREEIRDHDELFIPAGKGKTSFIDVRDLGEIGARTLVEDGHAGKAYTLTGSEALDYFEVAALLTRVLGRPIRYANPSGRAFKRRLIARGQPEDFARVIGMIYFIVRLGLAGRVTPDAEALLGRAPLRMEQFLRDHADLFRKQVAPSAA